MEDKLPKITIITPSYNQGEYIENTILSVINQNYSNLEYIIIDGGSTDNTVDVIKKYQKKIDYWVSEKDLGQSNAINKGARIATGEIINWLNSDDLLTENALNIVARNFINNKKLNLLVGSSYHFDDSKIIKHTTTPNQLSDLIYYYRLICIAQPSAFYKLSLFKENGYLNEDLHYGMDLDLWFKFYTTKNLCYKIIPDVLSGMRIHENQKTSANNAYAMLEIKSIVFKHVKNLNLRWMEKIKLFYKYRNLVRNSFLNSNIFSKVVINIKYFDVCVINLLKRIK